MVSETVWKKNRYDSRLGLCLGFRCGGLVRVRARGRLELLSVLWYWWVRVRPPWLTLNPP